MHYPSHSALQPTPGNCAVLASFVLTLVGIVRSNIPLQVVGLIVGVAIGYFDRNHTPPENRTWSARWKQLNRLLSPRPQSSNESLPCSVQEYIISEISRPASATPGMFERFTATEYRAHHIAASSANSSSSPEQHSSSPKPANYRSEETGVSTRTPAPAVQPVVRRRHTGNLEDSMSYLRRDSSNTDTRPSPPVSPTVAASGSGFSASPTTPQSDSRPSRPVSPSVVASGSASPTTVQSDIRPSPPISPTVAASSSASPTTAQSDQSQDAPSSSTPDDTLHDTKNLVGNPESRQDSSHGAASVHINDNYPPPPPPFRPSPRAPRPPRPVVVDQQQATTQEGIRLRTTVSGWVQRLNNYYQQQGVAMWVISYSHQAVPGIGYAATVTLSNFNPPGKYIGTGASMQAAKEAAARTALQALGVI